MVEKLHAAISHEHKLKFLDSPTEHPTIKLLMRSIRRRYTNVRNPVKPLEISHLRLINQHLSASETSTNLGLWRTVWRLNISYYTLCRFSELNCLTVKDLTLDSVNDPKLSFQIAKSKTDQNGIGKTVTVYSIPNDPDICPVLLTRKYLERLACFKKGETYDGYLQPRIHLDFKTKNQIPMATHVISYSSCLEDTKALLSGLGIEGRFGEHSGRRGGATAAAEHGAIPQEIQQLGRWKSFDCASKYVETSETQKEKIFRLLHPQ